MSSAMIGVELLWAPDLPVKEIAYRQLPQNLGPDLKSQGRRAHEHIDVRERRDEVKERFYGGDLLVGGV
jgi:hypothetical protein